MDTTPRILVFRSTHLTYKAESLLQRAGVACRLVAKPRHVSSDCGLALRLDEADCGKGVSLLAEAGIEVLTIC